MLSEFVIALALAARITAQQLPPTEQTSFSYPADGAGVTIPFPSNIATLTGLTDWPARWVLAPITPNIVSEYNPSATAILPDIVAPPVAQDFIQTFDDGPTNVSSILIDYLGTVNQKTTYFQIGTNVADNYLLTQRQYSEGHEIAVHTWSHPDLTTLSGQQVYAELAWAIYVIHSAIGQTPKLFRPPYGNINNVVRQAAAQLGLTAVLWSSDSNDWQIPNPPYTYQNVINTVAGFISSGAATILLEHELNANTVQGGQDISQMIINQGGRINVPVSAVFGDAQRYQGSTLVWPIVTSSGFDASQKPTNGTVGTNALVKMREGGSPACPAGAACPTTT